MITNIYTEFCEEYIPEKKEKFLSEFISKVTALHHKINQETYKWEEDPGDFVTDYYNLTRRDSYVGHTVPPINQIIMKCIKNNNISTLPIATLFLKDLWDTINVEKVIINFDKYKFLLDDIRQGKQYTLKELNKKVEFIAKTDHKEILTRARALQILLTKINVKQLVYVNEIFYRLPIVKG